MVPKIDRSILVFLHNFAKEPHAAARSGDDMKKNHPKNNTTLRPSQERGEEQSKTGSKIHFSKQSFSFTPRWLASSTLIEKYQSELPLLPFLATDLGDAYYIVQ